MNNYNTHTIFNKKASIFPIPQSKDSRINENGKMIANYTFDEGSNFDSVKENSSSDRYKNTFCMIKIDQFCQRNICLPLSFNYVNDMYKLYTDNVFNRKRIEVENQNFIYYISRLEDDEPISFNTNTTFYYPAFANTIVNSIFYQQIYLYAYSRILNIVNEYYEKNNISTKIHLGILDMKDDDDSYYEFVENDFDFDKFKDFDQAFKTWIGVEENVIHLPYKYLIRYRYNKYCYTNKLETIIDIIEDCPAMVYVNIEGTPLYAEIESEIFTAFSKLNYLAIKYSKVDSARCFSKVYETDTFCAYGIDDTIKMISIVTKDIESRILVKNVNLLRYYKSVDKQEVATIMENANFIHSELYDSLTIETEQRNTRANITLTQDELGLTDKDKYSMRSDSDEKILMIDNRPERKFDLVDLVYKISTIHQYNISRGHYL